VQIGKVQKWLTTILILAVLVGFEFPRVIARSNSFGVSPAVIRNVSLRSGSHFEREVVISRSNPDSRAVATLTVDNEKISDWITFSPGAIINLPKGKQRVIFKIIVDVPENIDIGIYNGNIRIVMKQTNAKGQVILLPAVALKLNLVVTNEDVEDLNIITITAPDILEGENVVMLLKAANMGNVPVAPGKMEIEFQSVSQVHYSYHVVDSFEQIKPFEESEQTVSIKENTLKIGDYFALVKVFDEDLNEIYSDRISISVVNNPNKKSSSLVNRLKDANNVYLFIGVGILFLSILLWALTRKKKEEE